MNLVCNSRGEALAALETIAEAMPHGKTREALAAVSKWVDENTYTPLDQEEVQKMMDKLITGTPYQKAGSDWKDSMELLRTGKLSQAPEPENLAELMCEYFADTKRWEPVTLARAMEKEGHPFPGKNTDPVRL